MSQHFLRTTRGVPDSDVGDILGWQFIGSAIGSLAWGWISDRYGRISAAIGFVMTAALIPIYLFLPMPIAALKALGLTYGLGLACSAIWGPWMSELYPPHLRSTPASIFNWGRVISMAAPLIPAPLAEIAAQVAI